MFVDMIYVKDSTIVFCSFMVKMKIRKKVKNGIAEFEEVVVCASAGLHVCSGKQFCLCLPNSKNINNIKYAITITLNNYQ